MTVGGLGASCVLEREQQDGARNQEKLAACKFLLKAALLQGDLSAKEINFQRNVCR